MFWLIFNLIGNKFLTTNIFFKFLKTNDSWIAINVLLYNEFYNFFIAVLQFWLVISF